MCVCVLTASLHAECWYDAAVEGVLVGQASPTPMAVKYIILLCLKTSL